MDAMFMYVLELEDGTEAEVDFKREGDVGYSETWEDGSFYTTEWLVPGVSYTAEFGGPRFGTVYRKETF